METGAIAKWNLQEGDKFDVGTSICEVETDKATVSFDATDEGYIAKILVTSGDITVGQPIMVTVEEEEDIAAFANFSLADAPAAAAAAATGSTTTTTTTPEPTAAAAVPPPVSQPAVAASAPAAVSSSGERVFASPLAKKLAREAGLPLAEIAQLLGGAGAGTGGRLVAADVMKAAAMPRSAATTAATTASTTTTAAGSAAPPASATMDLGSSISTSGSGVYGDFVLSDTARAIAARQTLAKQVVPHYYLSVELNLTQLLAMREALNATNNKSKDTQEGLSVLDFLVKASALAMKQVPDVNGAWMDTFVRRYEQVDINLVMGAGSFVTTPVLRDVCSTGLAEVSKQIAGFEDTLFAEEGQENELTAENAALGTFSIHNLGIYGVKSAAPIVLTPQACALSLGAIVDTVLPADADSAEGSPNWQVAPVMTATLSCDHRVVDGAVGAQWLSAFKALVENPMTMVL